VTAARPLPAVRRVEPDDWRSLRELRLAALQDQAAPIAFLDTFSAAAQRPDRYWQDRAANAAVGGPAAQFVGVTSDGAWVGSVTGLLEEPGTADVLGAPVTARQVHVVGVYVRPEHRGSGLLDRLLDELARWAREQGLGRARLYVHEENQRAQAAYRKSGFTPSGHRVNGALGAELEMVRAL